MQQIKITIQAEDIVTLYRRMILFDKQHEDFEMLEVEYNGKKSKFDKDNKPNEWLKKEKLGQWKDKQ